MAERDRNKTVRKSVELDTDLDTWYKETYPGVSIWWFMNTLMRAFMDLHNPKDRNIMQDKIEQAVTEVFPDK